MAVNLRNDDDTNGKVFSQIAGAYKGYRGDMGRVVLRKRPVHYHRTVQQKGANRNWLTPWFVLVELNGIEPSTS